MIAAPKMSFQRHSLRVFAGLHAGPARVEQRVSEPRETRMPSKAMETMLRESLWARTLTAEELDRVVRESYEREVPAAGFVMRRGEPADLWLGVIEGLVKMSVSLADGRISTFTGVTTGGWAGEGSLLKPGLWRYDGVAMRPTRMACVPRHTFERLVSTNLEFNRFLLLHINARLSLFIGLMEFDRLLGPDAAARA
jgi:CRP/FNR family cyclic AMP-dependent transcriptional regulator